MGRRLDIYPGHQFSRWTVVEEGPRSRWGARQWSCQCTYGSISLIVQGDLTQGKSKSCGCLVTEGIVERSTVHGAAGSPEYKIWKGMKTRCLNQKRADYERYGGRGISICPQWLNSFSTFLSDVGSRPSPQHSIDRVDNNGDYEPGNVRWATRSEQARNRRPFAIGRPKLST